jgi:hypothetical protein
MPKFNKMKGFSLKSGNKPTFQQMGSSSPGKMYDTPGKMYNAPLKAEDDKEEETTGDVDKKEPVKPRDKLGSMIGKIAANAAIGGFDAVTGHTTKRPTVNFGPDKAEEEAETLTIGQKMLKDDYELGDLTKAKKDKFSNNSTKIQGSLTSDYKKPSTKIQGSLR